MKLITKIQRYYFYISPIIIVLGIFVLYLSVNFFIYDNIEERIAFQKKEIIEQIQFGETPRFKKFIEIEEIETGIVIEEQLSDTLIFESTEGEEVPYRQLIFSKDINRKNYKIQIRLPLGETGQFVVDILKAVSAILFLIVITIYATNHFLNKKIWNEFYDILKNLKDYKLNRPNKIKIAETTIDEFSELNISIFEMTKKIEHDYLSLKEFTENASHEIQTPVAIIMLKIESLLQSENLTEDQMMTMAKISAAAAKLSRLTQSLLLITKIENMQFDLDEHVSLKDIIEKQILEFEELAAQRNITIQRQLDSVKTVNMNSSLAETLISNLLKNAILYCSEGGIIKISVSDSQISISNNGGPLQTAPEKLFERFVKKNNISSSLGLGLSIVKKICDLHNLTIQYSYKTNLHTFTITL
jgi:signal transduction histidine kinase